MSTLLAFVKENKAGVTLWCVAVLFACLAIGCAGGIEDLIKVNKPRDVAAAVDSPVTTTLPQARSDWQKWSAYVEANSEQFASALAGGEAKAEFLRNIIDMGQQAAAPFLGTLPGGAFLMSVFAGLGGLLTTKPGTAKVISKEKQASYNAGLEEGKRIALAGLGK